MSRITITSLINPFRFSVAKLLFSSRSRQDCSGSAPGQRFSRRRPTYLMRPSVSMG